MFSKISATLLFITILQFTAIAQEEIYFKSGKELRSDIITIDKTEVKYYRFNTSETISTPLAEIEKIILKDGTILNAGNEFGANKQQDVQVIIDEDPEDLQLFEGKDPSVLGKEDAHIYYHSYSNAGAATMVSTLTFPIAGLVVAIGTSSASPSTHEFNHPNHRLLQNPDYKRAYKAECKKIKRKQVWKNFGLAMGINIIMYGIILSGS